MVCRTISTWRVLNRSFLQSDISSHHRWSGPPHTVHRRSCLDLRHIIECQTVLFECFVLRRDKRQRCILELRAVQEFLPDDVQKCGVVRRALIGLRRRTQRFFLPPAPFDTLIHKVHRQAIFFGGLPVGICIVLFNLRRILLRTDGIQHPHAAVDAVAHHVLIQSVLLCNLQLYRRDEFIADGHAAVRLLFMSHRHGRRFLHIPSLVNPLTYSAERDIIIFRRLALCFSECHYYSSFYSMSNTSLISTSSASAIR